MTPYIQPQLKKLCDNPNWYDDMLWVYQAYKHTHPTNKNKVYHLTANNPNPIHLITNPGILHI